MMTDNSDSQDNPFGSNPQDSLPQNNPFQSPPEVRREGLAMPPGADRLLFHGAGFVRQVRAVAICMIVQGVLVSIMGAFLVGIGFFMGSMPPEEFTNGGAGLGELQMFMTWGYGIAGALVLISGLLIVVAGIRNLYFRGRIMAITALSLGILSSLTCYCAPTAIGLAIWGLVVYLNPSVARAFELSAEGVKPKDIVAMVARKRS